MRKRKIILGIVIALVFYSTLCLVFIAISHYNSNRTKKEFERIFDKIDQDIAIKQLSELRGRILEVKSLSEGGIPQSVLLNELEKIVSSKLYTNKYLEDFVFDIPNTSNTGEICEEFISQIDNQIHIIEYGKKGE